MRHGAKHSRPIRVDPRLAELLRRRPELRGIGISSIVEGLWSQ